jgi:hypothetical protein
MRRSVFESEERRQLRERAVACLHYQLAFLRYHYNQTPSLPDSQTGRSTAYSKFTAWYRYANIDACNMRKCRSSAFKLKRCSGSRESKRSWLTLHDGVAAFRSLDPAFVIELVLALVA